ncbi:MAG: type II toxin-antitoxin system RelE/ParE family toxin [Selenomonadaceae bacterium]|nr:type II toxin-antitoxin system RelE/ParE family toxin [Selenomonadaceae bacterium]
MSYDVIYTVEAKSDVMQILADVTSASGSVMVAHRYTSELLAKIKARRDFPRSGKPLYYQEKFTGYYLLIYKAYLVFYRVYEAQQQMEVVRILPGKMDYKKVLLLT